MNDMTDANVRFFRRMFIAAPAIALLWIGVAFWVASCSVTSPNVAAGVTGAVLPADQLATVERLCQAAQPMLNAASDQGLPPQVWQTAVYGSAYCNQLLGGTVPPTTDANTPSWLPQVIQGVQIAAEIAKVALPAILSL